MTTVKRKRGRPKKVVETKLPVEQAVEEPELNQIWVGTICNENGISLMEAGRLTFHTKSKQLEVVPMSESRPIPGWREIQRQLLGGLYTFQDTITNTTRDRSLQANSETAETWIEGIEHMKTPSSAGGNFVIRDLWKRFDDSEVN